MTTPTATETTATPYRLVRISRATAERLMMAPAVAGGWVGVHPDMQEATEEIGGGLLALLPSSWDDAQRHRVTTAQADRVIERLRRAARYSVVGEEDAARECLGWVEDAVRSGACAD